MPDQLNLTFLTEFELATIEQLVSYRIGKRKGETDDQVNTRIKKMVNCPKFIDVCIDKCKVWNENRIKLGLKPYK